jgi:ribonuclease BN (tRNA processing enzyme)
LRDKRTMRIRVLGCSGGIGVGLHTTSLLVDDDILIDAGTGVGELTLDEMAGIRHIFLTHCHLDHIAGIPLLVDSIFDRITTPITIHAQAPTLEALQAHIFNWVIWPDFTRLPTAEAPVLRYELLPPGATLSVEGREMESIPVKHIVPGVGYRVSSAGRSFAFSGDTCTNDSFWEVLNRRGSLDLLIVECAFANEDLELSRLAAHYCPSLLTADLAKLRLQPTLYLTHLKPGSEDAIFSEIRASLAERDPQRLFGGELLQL